MKRFILIALLLLTAAYGCNTKLEDPDQIPASGQLQLTASPDTIAAGGKGETIITARVPKDAGIISVAFTSTAGTFIQANAKTISQLTDSLSGKYRFANTVLKSDTTGGAVYITATATTTLKRLQLTFQK